MTIELDRISIGRPSLRVALADDIPADSSAIVVRRPTLRDAQRARSLLRAGTRDTANFSVALEVEVAIAPSAASARAAVAHIPDDIDGGTVRYVGTPSGLVTHPRHLRGRGRRRRHPRFTRRFGDAAPRARAGVAVVRGAARGLISLRRSAQASPRSHCSTSSVCASSVSRPYSLRRAMPPSG